MSVAVNAGQVVDPVNDQILGVNVSYWDALAPTTQTQQLVEAAGLTMIRFPGGTASDTWHFNDPPTYSVGGVASTMANLASSLGAGAVVTLDYGSGSPQEAAALLAYFNGSAYNATKLGFGEQWDPTTNTWIEVNWQTAGYWASLREATPLAQDDGLNFLRVDHPLPFNIKYFEVGNEIYGSWETDYHGQGGDTGKAHDPATYVAFAKQFAAYAAQIDPYISIGVDTGSPLSEDFNNWTENVLQIGAQEGFIPGFLSDHSYMEEPGSESDSTLLLGTVSDPATTLDWVTRAAAYRTLLDNTVGATAAEGVQLLATEFNSVDDDPGKQSTSLVNGLFVADSLGSLLEAGYDGAMIWDLHNSWNTGNNNSSSLYGWREGGDYGLLGGGSVNDPPVTGANVPYPSYFAEQLASKIAQPGGAVVASTSGSNELSVYAVKEQDGDLELLVINKDPANGQTANFQFTGFQASGAATVWQYGEAQDTAQSESASGSSALVEFASQLTGSGSTFSYSFPQYSMTVLVLQPVGLAAPTTASVAHDGTLPFSGAEAISVGDVVSDSSAGSVALGVNSGALALTTSGVTVSSGASGSSAVTISGTLSALDAALATLVYIAPTSGATDSLTVSIKDAALASNTLTTAITLTVPAPVVAGPTTASIAHGGTLAFSGANAITVSDGGASTVTVLLSVMDATIALKTSGVTISGGASGTSAVAISGTLAAVNAALATLAYTAPSSGASDTLLVTAIAGGLEGKLFSAAITLTYATPVVSGPKTASIPMNGTLAFSGANAIKVNDIDAGSTLDWLSLTVSNGAITLNTSGATLSSGANGSVHMLLYGTLAELNAALATLVYTAPQSAGSVTLTVTATVRALQSALNTAITVTAVAPVVVGPTTVSVAYGGILAFSGANTITVSDIGAGSTLGWLSLTVSSGVMTLNTSGATLSSGANGSDYMLLYGTLAELNAALATLVYTAPASGASATLTVTATVGSLKGALSTAITLTGAAS